MFHISHYLPGVFLRGSSKTANEEPQLAHSSESAHENKPNEAPTKVQRFCTVDQKHSSSTNQDPQIARVEALRERSEHIWKAAESLRESARGWGDGDPDSIQEIMNRYAPYRFYAAYDESKKNISIRHQKALEMMHEIANHQDGWPPFREKYCHQTSESTYRCRGYEYNLGTISHFQCDFGIRKKVKNDNCTRLHPGNYERFQKFFRKEE